MLKSLYILLLLSFSYFISAQSEYWQQHVEYRINAQLDSTTQDLKAKCAITYKNNSPDTLDRIYFHLWANAFNNKNTPFAKQALKLGMTDFYFANQLDLGGYLEIKAELPSDEGSLNIIYEEEQNEIAYIPIKGGLPPGSSISIIFYYRLDVPTYFARLGKTDDIHNMVAWYPKPAVYDAEGWQTMPYLAMGEFYSEFADYDVTLSVKEDYVIAHSGIETERYTNNGYQYINTQLENAHDYAWFASKKFMIENEKVELKNGQIVDLKIYSNPENETWKDAMLYSKQVLEFMSDYMGDYPYSTLSIVQGDDSGLGGAMEYPSIKIIKNVKSAEALEYYIAHEIGHSWFYAALGTNERDESYFDEGLTTYLEQKYTAHYHNGSNHYDRILPKLLTSEDKPTLRHFTEGQICRHMHQPLTTPATEISGINYGLNAYQIGSTLITHIESLLGYEKVKMMLQSFYAKWKYKHPSYDDLLQHIELESGLDLNGYQDILAGKAVDMSIKKIEDNTIQFENNGEPQFEVPIVIEYEDGTIERKNVEPYNGFALTASHVKIKSAEIDPEHTSLDINPANNKYPRGGLGVKLLPRWDRAHKKDIYLMPIGGYNSFDGLMLGLSAFNSTFPAKKIKWNISPIYGLRSKKLVGQSWISYDARPTSDKIRKIQYRLGIKSFSASTYQETDRGLRYIRIDPSISLHHNHSPASKKYSKTTLRQIWTDTETSDEGFDGLRQNITRLTHSRKNFDVLQPSELKIDLEYNNYSFKELPTNNYLKLSLDYRHGFMFSSYKRFDIRFYAAGFLKNTQRQSSSFNNIFAQGSLALLSQGFTDYSYDDYFLDRRGQSDLAYRQIGYHGGGFKDALGSAVSIGESNDFAMAINIKSHLPVGPKKLPIKIFFDAGYARTKSFNSEPLTGEILYSGGIMYEVMDGLFAVYLPLIASNNISEIYEIDNRNILSKITFSIDLNRYNPWDLADEFNF